MTVNSLPPRLVISSSTGTGPFTIPFSFISASDLTIYKNGALITAGFTINVTAKTITLSTPLTVLDSLIVSLDPDLEQEFTFPRFNPLSANNLEACFDYITNLIKVINYRAGRLLAVTETSNTKGAVLEPLDPNKILFVTEDGKIGFYDNAGADIDELADKVEAMVPGLITAAGNPNTLIVASIISSVIALSLIVSTITGVASNSANINTVFGLKDLIDSVIANQAKIASVAATGAPQGNLYNYIWNGGFPYVARQGDDITFTSTTGNTGSNTGMGIGVGFYRASAPVSVKYIPINSKDGTHGFRFKRKSAYTGKLEWVHWIQCEALSGNTSGPVTLGFRLKTGSQFAGTVHAVVKSASTNQKAASPISSVSHVNTGTTTGAIAVSDQTTNLTTLVTNTYTPGVSAEQEIIINFNLPASTGAILICIGCSIASTTWQNPDLSELDEWIQLEDIYMVRGTFTSRPDYEISYTLADKMMRVLASEPYGTPINAYPTSAARITLLGEEASNAAGTNSFIGWRMQSPLLGSGTNPTSGYTAISDGGAGSGGLNTDFRRSPLTGNKLRTQRISTGLEYDDGSSNATANNGRFYNNSGLVGLRSCCSMPLGDGVRFVINNSLYY